MIKAQEEHDHTQRMTNMNNEIVRRNFWSSFLIGNFFSFLRYARVKMDDFHLIFEHCTHFENFVLKLSHLEHQSQIQTSDFTAWLTHLKRIRIVYLICSQRQPSFTMRSNCKTVTSTSIEMAMAPMILILKMLHE